jgi:hypothetical protein
MTVLACCYAVTACSSNRDGTDPTQASERGGSIGLALQIQPGVTINTVSYAITGSAGFTKSGAIDVSNSTTIASVIGGLPAGSGFSITLSATSTDGSESCAGSATFNVVAHQTSAVSVHLTCHEAPRNGSVMVNGSLNLCPAIDAVSANPSEVLVGSSLTLSATAHDTDNAPSPLSYKWSASSGAFSDPTAQNPRFTCTAAGSVTITLTASDGDPAASCADTSRVTVNCTAATGNATCALQNGAGAIKHVIYLQFDNTHLRRDRTVVPSDLEQMPSLLSFIRTSGSMLSNDHTVLISHTGGGILSTLTGMYPDRHGQTVSNSYVRITATGGFQFPSSFGYWTDPAAAGLTVPNMVGPDGTNTPAPWTTFTRAGCDVGAVAAANIVLENTGTGSSGDVTKVFGAGSPQFAEATASASAASGSAARNLAQTDLVGFAVHCAQGSATCANGQTDSLPQEPGGYTGFKGLFGAQAIDPLLTGQPASVALTDLLGQPIQDPFGQPGFPGFDGMEAAVSLSYVAAMQEHGIPVTFAYISDAHDFHGVAGNAHNAFGPGDPGYVQQLKDYDTAFANFFARLAADGIDKSNTLFVFTVDEGDHFVGGTPTPVDCDGVTTPCDWTNQVGEINSNIDTLVTHQFPDLAAKFLASSGPDTFTVHGDDAPPFYLAKKGVGALGQTDPDTRQFERTIAGITAVNPYTGATDPLLTQMVDQTGMKALHMFTTGDPARNAQFTFFADADYFITDFPTSTCETCINPAFAWNHGDIQPEIGNTWIGFVGPGVVAQGDNVTFTDHTDVRPTILSLVGLRDTYQADGRAITQVLMPSAQASSVSGNLSTVEALGSAYKEIQAPFGPFALATLTVSTHALKSDDATYTSLEASLAALVTRRDNLAVAVRSALDGATFANTPIDTTQAQTWISQAEQLLADAAALASGL